MAISRQELLTLMTSLERDRRSLMPMAMEARKPMFELTPADGAIGAHTTAVRNCREDFQKLAEAIASRIGLRMAN